jgi:putative membrane protein
MSRWWQMWCNWTTMGFLRWTMMIVFWGAIAALVVWAARGAGTTRTGTRPDALSILERRYATGEIDRDEFTERRRVLEAHQETRR